MPELRGRWASIIFACVIIACAAVILSTLLVSASNDNHPGAWPGRTLGFVMAAVALMVGVAIIVAGKRGETHYWGMLTGLILAALITGAYSYETDVPQMGEQAETIPLEIGNWVGRSMEVDEKTKRVLGTEDMIMRIYHRRKDVVNLAVIFSMGKRKVTHPPEQCYAAGGTEIEDIAYDSFVTEAGRKINGRRLVLMGRGGRQAVLYWYRVGDVNTGNFLRQQAQVILSNLLMRSGTRVALIRLSTYIGSPDEEKQGMTRLKDFARAAFPEIEKALK